MQFAATPLSVSRKQVTTQPVAQSMTFAQAFRHARANGLKVFNWNGRSYNTNLAQDSIEAAVPKETIVSGREIAPSSISADRIKPNTIVVDTAGFVANRPSIGQKEKPWNFWDVILARR